MPNNWPKQIRHVVVLMMENRSFDHLLGDYRSLDGSCDGVDRAQPRSNPLAAADGGALTQQAQDRHDLGSWAPPPDVPAEARIGFDFGHEFDDVMRQLDVSGTGPLGAPKLDGFADDAYRKAQADLKQYRVYALDMAQRAMNYVRLGDTPDDDPLPAIQGLARHFTLCDRWFSSVPGPTWPNRFFAMTGSARGHVLMPGKGSVLKGIQSLLAMFGETSIFSLLKESGLDARIYSDGRIPLAAFVRGGRQRYGIDDFKRDVAGDNLPQLAWIEPDYGLLGRIAGFNDSHHPPEDLRFGDRFVGEVFNVLPQHPEVWKKTLFVLLYDEHGGFHDHVVPPLTQAPDASPADAPWLANGAAPFTRLGLRVPAILASPWLRPGLMPWQGEDIQAAHYDHTSLLAFLCDHFGLDRQRLGARVAAARHFGEAPIWLAAPTTQAGARPFQLALTPLPARAVAQSPETGLATSTRQVLNAAMAYLGGQDPEPAWAAGLTPGSADAAPGTRGLALGADALEAHLRRLQDLLASTYADPPEPRRQGLRALPAEPAHLRLLCVHGVGHGDAGDGASEPQWRSQWRAAIRQRLAENGCSVADEDIDFLPYDDLFGDGPSFAQQLRGVAMLLDDVVGGERERSRWGVPVDQRLRWTVGMTVQWLEDAPLRSRLCERLLRRIDTFQPQIILAHSLGSLIAYDALRRAVVKGGSALQRIDGRVLVSFGSQIGHPLVLREVWGGRVMRLNDNGQGIRRWFHLYNPHDHVFTRPLATPDSSRIDLVTPFDIPWRDDLLDLNHAGEAYLNNAVCQQAMWPQLAASGVRERSLGVPAFLSRSGQRKRRALLVGINDYADPRYRLNGCLNDTYRVSRMLQESGYDAGDIRLLHNQRATRDNLLERLEWLVEGARPGDERVFFYSGHGTQIPQYSDNQEADHLDETLVLYDFDWDDAASYFTDKQFRQFYSHLPFDPEGHGARLSVIFDCCHASGMTRGPGAVRGLSPPSDIRHRLLRWDAQAGEWQGRRYTGDGAPRDFSAAAASVRKRPLQRQRGTQGSALALRPDNEGQLRRQARLYGHSGPYLPLLLYAARENQAAGECQVGPDCYGRFTYELVEQIGRLRATNRAFSYAQLMQAVAQQLRDSAQTPELVGPGVIRDSACPWRPV